MCSYWPRGARWGYSKIFTHHGLDYLLRNSHKARFHFEPCLCQSKQRIRPALLSLPPTPHESRPAASGQPQPQPQRLLRLVPVVSSLTRRNAFRSLAASSLRPCAPTHTPPSSLSIVHSIQGNAIAAIDHSKHCPSPSLRSSLDPTTTRPPRIVHVVLATMGNSKSQISCYEEGSLEINLSHFKLLRVVGKGSYGKVCASLKQPTDSRSASSN
jgi:hypothetical protein